MSSFPILSFIFTTASVMILTYIIVSKMKKSDSPVEEYFTAGRSLSWPIIGGSLLLTNISTEQLVGLNGDVFGDKALVGIAWEALAAFAMIATALIFLPRYLASGFTTTPAFLEKRFDKATRSLVSGLFLFGYVTVLLPVVLYTGSLVLKGMFSLQIPLFFVVLVIGALGGGYAILGGLKTVAVSDTINGIGLFIGGLAVPILALVEFSRLPIGPVFSTKWFAAILFDRCDLSPSGRGGALRSTVKIEPHSQLEISFVFHLGMSAIRVMNCLCLGSWNAILIRLRIPVEVPFPMRGCIQPPFCIVARFTGGRI